MEKMKTLWSARFSGEPDEEALSFESSIRSDARLYPFDIALSIAHVEMLKEESLIKAADADAIIRELKKIKTEMDDRKIEIDERAEDIHSFIENILTSRLGEVGKAVHAARSRNDQIATDEKLYLRHVIKNELTPSVISLIRTLLGIAKKHTTTVMAGYTHLQRAQPVSLAHHLCAWAWMLLRDAKRMEEAFTHMSECPLGAAALSGTTLPINRESTAKKLGFTSVVPNSMDAVAERDYVLECASIFSITMMHLSRFSEEIVIFSSFEWGFISLSDEYSTGSSMMPQKKNPDFAELIRSRSSRVYGNMMSLFSMMKGLPLSYNRDMQEDKESLFSSVDILSSSLVIFKKMIASLKWNEKKMRESCDAGFMNATYLAEYLVKKGVPFRSAHEISARAVRLCMYRGIKLEELEMSEYKKLASEIEDDLYEAIKIEGCLYNLRSEGSANPDEVEKQIEKLEVFLQTSKESALYSDGLIR